jgi:hypothetical protein
MERLPEVEQLENFLAEIQDWREELIARKIKIYTDAQHPELTILSYDIGSSRACPITNSCRGVVINNQTKKVVSYSFTRFFNYNEFYAQKFDWASARAEEKLDGSLLTLYPHNDQWLVATTGTPCASGPVNPNSSKIFRELFWEVYDELGYPEPSKKYIYIFELCTEDNKVVLAHKERRLVLLCIRSSETFQEIPNWKFLYHTIKHETPQIYTLNEKSKTGTEDLVKGFNSQSQLDTEGVVLVDKDNNRLKCKNGLYVQAHALLNNNQPNFARLYLSDSVEEFVSYFPEFKEPYSKKLEKIEQLNEIVLTALKDDFLKTLFGRDRFDYLGKYGDPMRVVLLEILKHNTHEQQFDFYDFIKRATVYQFQRLQQRLGF